MLDFAGMSEGDLAALRRAVALLEHPGLAARLTNMVGKPIELIGYALPASASQVITTATSKALEMALEVALRSMHRAPRPGSQLLHKALATASGAAGGAFGLAALPIELPVSTIIMLRSIAESREARARICPIRKLRCRACRYSRWADGRVQPMLPRADILPCAACWRKASRRLRALSSSAA